MTYAIQMPQSELFRILITNRRLTYGPLHSPDIFALGFQEIVPLTAQQIVQTDPEKKCVERSRQ